MWRLVRTADFGVAGRCRYDLTGLPVTDEGRATCPECGLAVHVAKRALRGDFAWRVGRIGAALVLASMAMFLVPSVRSGQWVRLLPTSALVVIERVPHGVVSRPVREELDGRIGAGRLKPWQEQFIIPSLVVDLRDDAVEGNAKRAMRNLLAIGSPACPALEGALASGDRQQRHLAAHILRQQNTYVPSDRMLEVVIEMLRDDEEPWNAQSALWWLGQWSDAAVPFLEKALESEDWQQRQLAAYALQGIEGYKPTDAALRVSVEGLRDDALPYGGGAYSWICNAKSSLRFLTDHAEQAEPMLSAALRSDDPQQRFLAAVACGWGGRSRLVGTVAPVLIDHLRDNDIRGDAKLACGALYSLGLPVIPYLEPHTASEDMQLADAARLIVETLRNPAPSDEDRRARWRLNRITSLALDPLELTLGDAMEDWAD